MVTIYLYEHRSRCFKNIEIFIYSIRHIKLGNEKLLILMFMYSLYTMSCIIFLEGIEKTGNIRGFFFLIENPHTTKLHLSGKRVIGLQPYNMMYDIIRPPLSCANNRYKLL